MFGLIWPCSSCRLLVLAFFNATIWYLTFLVVLLGSKSEDNKNKTKLSSFFSSSLQLHEQTQNRNWEKQTNVCCSTPVARLFPSIGVLNLRLIGFFFRWACSRKCRRWPPAGSPTAAGLSTAAARSPTARPSRRRSTTQRSHVLSSPALYYH